MTFKTDTIKLDFNIANDTAAEAESPVNGTLALVGNAGSKQLLLRDNGSWGSVLGDSLVTSLSDLSDVGESPSTSSENEVAFLYNNAGDLELRFQKLTVDNLSSTNFLSVSDLSDTNTPTTIGAPDEGKVFGVILGSGVISSMTFDYSASVDGNPLAGLLNFTAGGNDYQIFFDGTQGTTQSVNFVYDANDATYEAIVAGGYATVADSFVDLETLLNNTFGASGFTISSNATQVIMTADSAGVNAGISGLSFVNGGNGLAISSIDGEDAGYEYNLIDSSNWDTAYGWGDHQAANYVQNYTWSTATALTEDVTIGTQLNQKLVMMADPQSYKFNLPNSASSYTENTIIEIINHSNYDQILSTGGLHPMYLTNTQVQNQADITIERGQRVLIMPNPGYNIFFVSILVA